MPRVDLDQLASELARRVGLALDLERGAASVEGVVKERLRATASGSLSEYFGRITPAELGALAARLTVGETYFFRYREQFDALGAALPELVAARCGRPLRILSAGCSSGEEADTIAIVVRSTLTEPAVSTSTILGVDVNPEAIGRAKRGRYSEWSMRETSAAMRARWFRVHGKEVEVDAGARALVSFTEGNLVDADDPVWRPEAFDVVFCRNALMYFDKDAAEAVIERVVRSLSPGGLFFLGPTETHLGRATGLTMRHSHGAFYYQRVDGAEPTTFASSRPPQRPSNAVDSALDTAHTRTHGGVSEGIDLGRQSSAATVPKPLHSAFRRSAFEPVGASTHLGPSLRLLREERFDEALRALPSDADGDPETQWLRGVLLSSSGDVAGAERAHQAVLALSPLHAGAHYMLALCREHRGDIAGAVEHDRAAIYIEPRFAMPHMHLGLLARRRGNIAEATRELRLASGLLAEDDPNLLLFGGGLRAEALINLCRAELRACGVTT